MPQNNFNLPMIRRAVEEIGTIAACKSNTTRFYPRRGCWIISAVRGSHLRLMRP